MACVAMKPAFGEQSAWLFFHAWLGLRRRRHDGLFDKNFDTFARY